MDNYIISEITIDYIFKKFGSIDNEQSVLEQSPPVAITAVVCLGIQSYRDWMTCTGAFAHAAS